jgi:hypothetical protein
MVMLATPLARAERCANLTRTFSGASVEAQIAGDCWLYGHVFVFERKHYRITHYHLSGCLQISVVVTLEACPEVSAQRD